uniref:Microtubule-associated protein 1Sb n=1 Tax=Amphiprion percula TaxID=161767 RepID=A0A3P8T1Z4_AMPPE
MASSRVLEREVQEEQRRAATANLDFCLHKYSLLIIIGRTARHRQTDHISRDIERGIRSWDVDLKSCNLNLYLQEFLSHHTASFKGQKCLRHSTRVLDTQVLISPSLEQVFALLSRESAHKLMILAGLSEEESGDLLFHKGLFSPHQLKQIITDSVSSKINLTLSCPNIGQWRKTLLGNQPLQGPFTLHINPPEVLPAMEGLGEFTSLISGTVCPPSPFDLLPPPTTVGFLKLSRPCCYVFPAGRGDCAFFAVSGFTVLVDGGSDSQACFWKLVRHLDRVDAVLLTHIGTENLPGVVSFLERKVAEVELSTDRLISPELGVVFFNAPSRLQMEQQAAVTLQLLKKLDIRPQPMFRPQGVPIESITLFQKMGVGQLDLYILTPVSSASKSQTLPVTALASVSALLVWHPACPQEKVVRVLFPGITPQAKLLQGLEKLKGLAFLQKPTVTTGDLERLGEDRKTKRTESQDSIKSKEGTPKHGKGGVKEEGKDAKKNGAPSKPKNENKTKLKKEAKNDSKTGEKKTRKPSGKEANDGKKVNVNTELPNNSSTKPDAGSKIPEQEGIVTEQESQKTEKELEENPCESKISTPEDMTADFLRATLSRIQAQMSESDSADVNQPNGSSRQNEGQLKNTPESHTNAREKHISFLSLGSFKDGSSDHSPSVATTTTTHSMPAEVSSPQSTEVDESLSMSFEQGPTTMSNFVGMSLPMKKPPRSLGSEMGRPLVPNTLHFEASAHDVDLCLVSPCEFKHFKAPDSSSGASEASRGAPHQHGNNNNNPKDMSPSESNAPVCTEDCPSTTADGALDSDEEDSCSEPSNSPHELHGSQALPPDPAPAPLRDSPPLPPHPDASMPVIEGSQKPSSGKSRTGGQSGATKGNVSVYVDLAYIPSGASFPTVSVDFFRCVRSSCYIISGDSPEREELMRQTLDALLDRHFLRLQVTVIPTFESASMQEWYQQTLDRQKELGITVLGSNSTVAMQDETFPACKIEF